MNRRDPSDAELRAAFRARIDAAPEPAPAMLARTLAAIGPATPERRRAKPLTPARWWRALAAPARFALAAAIVLVSGTLIFGTLKITRERVIADRLSAASGITLERRPASPARIAHSGTMRLAVRDVSGTVRRIIALAEREHGTILALSTNASTNTKTNPSTSTSTSGSTAEVTVRIPSARLDAMMQAVALLGSVRERKTTAVDIAALFDEIPSHHGEEPGNAATSARLEQRRQLADRLANATLAVTLNATEAGRLTATRYRTIAELSAAATRRTGIPLARGHVFAPYFPAIAYRRARPLAPRSPRAAAPGPFAR